MVNQIIGSVLAICRNAGRVPMFKVKTCFHFNFSKCTNCINKQGVLQINSICGTILNKKTSSTLHREPSISHHTAGSSTQTTKQVIRQNNHATCRYGADPNPMTALCPTRRYGTEITMSVFGSRNEMIHHLLAHHFFVFGSVE